MHSKENVWFGPVREHFVYDHVLIRIHQQFLAYFILHFFPSDVARAGVRGVIVNKLLEQSMLFIVHHHPY